MEKPIVKLVGEDGNAFTIIGRCRRAAKEAKWPRETIQKVLDEAMSGDYNHLLSVVQKHFEVV